MHMRIQRGQGSGTPPPPKITKIQVFSKTGPDPLKIVKLPSQLSIVGHNQHTSKTPFQWRYAGGLKIVVFVVFG